MKIPFDMLKHRKNKFHKSTISLVYLFISDAMHIIISDICQLLHLMCAEIYSENKDEAAKASDRYQAKK